jgi:hypothetical protein
MSTPLSLTDRQMRLVTSAARAVPVSRRDEFLRRLALHLAPQPSNSAVQAALNAQLDSLEFYTSSSGASERSEA